MLRDASIIPQCCDTSSEVVVAVFSCETVPLSVTAMASTSATFAKIIRLAYQEGNLLPQSRAADVITKLVAGAHVVFHVKQDQMVKSAFQQRRASLISIAQSFHAKPPYSIGAQAAASSRPVHQQKTFLLRPR